MNDGRVQVPQRIGWQQLGRLQYASKNLLQNTIKHARLRETAKKVLSSKEGGGEGAGAEGKKELF